MKKISKVILAVGSTLMCLSTANAGVPNGDNPRTFLGPTARGSFTSLMSDSTALSLAGEAGGKNFRVGGTLGWRADSNQRFKLSIEYLSQDITYSFFSGNTNQWVNQGAVGAAYQYLFYDYAYQPSLDVSAYYSHAPSRTLHSVSGTFLNPLGVPQTFINPRRIAGSNVGGAAPGVSFHPWGGSKAGVELNYDDVRYDMHLGHNRNANGFGGTVRLSQRIVENIEVGASAAIRRPFNNYAANVAWINLPYFGSWRLGLFGDYTAGKNALSNTYDAGISADYFFDSCAPRMNLNSDLKNEAPLPIPVRDDFLEWTADPAVYMPQVLAVIDQEVTSFCTLGVPKFFGAIANGSFNGGTTQTINTAPHFTGSGLAFSVTAPKPRVGTSTVTINHVTGVVTVTGLRSTTSITVTAKNLCGVAVSNTFTETFN